MDLSKISLKTLFDIAFSVNDKNDRDVIKTILSEISKRVKNNLIDKTDLSENFYEKFYRLSTEVISDDELFYFNLTVKANEIVSLKRKKSDGDSDKEKCLEKKKQKISSFPGLVEAASSIIASQFTDLNTDSLTQWGGADADDGDGKKINLNSIGSEIDSRNNTIQNERKCSSCNNKIVLINDWKKHLKSQKHIDSLENNFLKLHKNLEIIHKFFNGKIITYRIRNENEAVFRCKEFMISIKGIVKEICESYLDVFKNVKINFKLNGLYSKPPLEEISTKCFNTRNFIFQYSTTFNEFFEEIMEIIERKSEEFQEKDSGWSLLKILNLEMNLHKNNSLKGSSYIPLPKTISQKRAIINIKNEDEACFAWAIVSALHPAKNNKERMSSYPHYKDILNLSNINFPMKIQDIPLFEKNNDLSVNVFGLDEEFQVVGPYHHTNKRNKTHINLLFLDDSDGNQHYCWIKDLSRLISMQLSKHKTAKFICDGCLVYFQQKELLDKHQQSDCIHVKTILPPKGSKLKFKNPERQMKVIYTLFSYFNK